MISRWHHTFEMAFPILAVTGAIVGAIVAAGATLSLMDVERPASAAMAVMGDGVDEFFLRSAAVGDTLKRLGQESSTLMILAVAATVISLLAIILHLVRSLRSTGDVRGFISYVMDRVRLMSYERHPWGTVSDSRTGHPVPLARITLVAADGRVVARAVADVAGRYGFGIPLSRVAGTLVSVHVRKGAYYHYHRRGPLPMLARQAGGMAADSHTADVPLDPVGSVVIPHTGTDKVTATLASAAFWVSVATVPLAASVAPNPLSFLLWAGLAATTLGRLCGLAVHHQS